MTPIIYTIEDFEELLSEQAIGTQVAMSLTDFVVRLDKRNESLTKRLELAEKIIGEYELHQRMIESDYE